MPQINKIISRKNTEVKKKKTLIYIFLFLKLSSYTPWVLKEFPHLGELPAQLLSS